jgi:hypothetical protein
VVFQESYRTSYPLTHKSKSQPEQAGIEGNKKREKGPKSAKMTSIMMFVDRYSNPNRMIAIPAIINVSGKYVKEDTVSVCTWYRGTDIVDHPGK